MKSKILSLLILLNPFYICGQNNSISSRKNEIFRIDMANSHSIDFNHLVKEIACTQLEIKNVPTFDYCERMTCYQNYIYLMGRTIAGSKILIYKTSGKFVKEITFSDGLLLNSMIVIPERAEFWVISRFKIINKFRLDGTEINRISLPFPCVNLFPVDKQNFLVYDGGGEKSIEGHSMALTDFKSIHKLFLVRTGNKGRAYSPQSMYAPNENQDNLYIFPDCSDTVYFYNSKVQEVKPYFYLDFHGDFLIRKMYPNGGFSDKAMSDIITKRTYIYANYSFGQAGYKLFFKFAGKREDFCTIDLKDNSVQSFSRLFDNYEPTTFNPIVGCDGKKIYVIIRENQLCKHYQKNRCTYPAIKKLLPTLSVAGNSWILVAIEIKNKS